MMSTTPEDVERLITELADLREQHTLLSEHMEDRCGREINEIRDIETILSEHKERIDVIRLAMQEREEETHEDLLSVGREIDLAERAIKQACYDLPTETLKKGTTIELGRFKVSVSRASIRSEYRSEALLDAHPELEEIYIDGDPIVGRTIDGDILDRAISGGQFSEDDAVKYRITKRIRNPQVRIKESTDAQSI